MYLHELFKKRRIDHDLRNSFRKLTNPSCILTIWNGALATAVPYCGILFLKVLGRLDQLGSLRRKLTAHLKHSIPTRQSCKSVLKFFNFCIWLYLKYYCHYWRFWTEFKWKIYYDYLLFLNRTKKPSHCPSRSVFSPVSRTWRPAIFKETFKLFGPQGCSEDKNWVDFSSIFFNTCRFHSSILLSL